MYYTTEALLEGIGKSDNVVLTYIYKEFFPVILNFVKKNSGDEADAQDLFQEAVIVIFRKIKKEPLTLNCNFKTYIYSICRFLWLKQLEKKNKNDVINSSAVLENRLDETSKAYEQTEKYRLYQKHFKFLAPNCQQLLQLSLERVSLREIAKIMGFRDEKCAKRRKHLCKQALIESIKNDDLFKELCDE